MSSSFDENQLNDLSNNVISLSELAFSLIILIKSVS